MTWVAVAVGGSALIGAAASKSASDKSAKGVSKGLSQSKELSDSSRVAAVDLYNRGRKSQQTGLTAAMDFYKKAVPSRYTPAILGNVAAQKAIGQGAAQANNAILGNPVDMSFAQAQQINPDLSYLQAAQMPSYAGDYGNEPIDPSVVATQSAGQSSTDKVLTAGGLLANPKDMLNPKSAITNPGGLGSKLSSKSLGNKILKKIF